jgi:V8-like Glu-specific endopeptidase/uncharacterized membrane protein
VKYLSLILMLLLASLACAEEQTVIGVDNRVLIAQPQEAKPYSMIGQLRYNRNSQQTGHCTASLVGPNLILTNAHCVFWVSNTKPAKMYEHYNFVFLPSYAPNKANLEISAQWLFTGTQDPTRFVSADYTLLVLSQNIGNELGYFNMSNTHYNQINGKTISTAGYSGDIKGGQYMSAHQNCKITSVQGDLNNNNLAYLRHNCDSTVGASGSPLFMQNGNQYTIVGLHSRGASGHVADHEVNRHNSAVHVAAFYEDYKKHFKDAVAVYYDDEVEVEIENCSSPNQKGTLTQLASDMYQIEKLTLSETPAVFNLCNSKAETLHIAIAFQDTSADDQGSVAKNRLLWHSKGWTKIPSKKCQTFEASHLKVSEAYYHVKELGSSSQKSFCVKEQENFMIKLANKTCPEGASAKAFTQSVSLSHDRPQTINLLD